MSVKLADIAERLGLSEATVSLALNNKEVVNVNTRRRVREAAEEMGYLPNELARGLAGQKKPSVGLVITDISNTYFGELAKMCEKKLTALGFDALFGFSGDQPSREEAIIEHFAAQRAAGVIIVPSLNSAAPPSYLKRLDRLGIRYVFCTSYYDGTDAPFVMADLEGGAYRSVKYLLELGHREIYFIGAPSGCIPAELRAAGYRRALLECGLSAPSERFIGAGVPDFENGRLCTQRLIESGRRVDAIAAINDLSALGALRALMEAGLSVPGDISLCGFDDIIFSSVAAIPLTTVRQDVRLIADKTVELLRSMIESGEQTHEHIFTPAELIVRSSTGAKGS